MGANPLPVCAVCTERLGKYGGPCTLACGHNGCLQCLRSVQGNHAACPLCRARFDPAAPLVVNTELRDLVHMAAALTTEDSGDGWQAVTSSRGRPGWRQEAGADELPYMPSAPPAPGLSRVGVEAVLHGEADVLSLEPPLWLPDSAAAACMAPGCGRPFAFLVRSRHHCRCCGGILCTACTSFLLLPPRFHQPEPQRVCAACAELLMPVQPLLAGTVSRAVQPPVHDTTDWSVWRSLINFPHSDNMEGDLFKAANGLRQASASLGALKPERGLPQAVFAEAQGLAVLSMLKAACGWSCAFGTGVVCARRLDGSWSAPSSLLAVTTGVGWQLGAEVADVLVVLRTPAAIKAFCGSQLGLGGSMSIAAGPLGRTATATASASLAGGATMLSYSLAKGLFAGVGLDCSLLRARDAVNWRFYGRRLTAKALLTTDAVAPPAGASAFYAALDAFISATSQPAAAAAQHTASHSPAASQQQFVVAGKPEASPPAAARGVGSARHYQQPASLAFYVGAHDVSGALPLPVAAEDYQQQQAQAQVYQQEAEDAPWAYLFD